MSEVTKREGNNMIQRAQLQCNEGKWENSRGREVVILLAIKKGRVKSEGEARPKREPKRTREKRGSAKLWSLAKVTVVVVNGESKRAEEGENRSR